ncbi:MAG: OadG family protein [Bacteroidaceae bacterium]|nr:OadG family protein [Bacteroidaceae bacterium]
MENMGLGLTLMGIGMVTVFAILLIVINLSKLLINIVNKVAPEEEASKKVAPAPSKPIIDSTVMAIIQAAVSEMTGGKGTVANVEKL